MDDNITYTILILNFLISVSFFLRRKCEIPFFIAFFNLLVEYRFYAIKNGYANWIDMDYGISFIFNTQQGNAVSGLIILGSSLLIYSFILFYKPYYYSINDTNALLKEFILDKKMTIVICLVIFTMVQLFLIRSLSLGYGFLAKLGTSSFIILLFLIVVFTNKNNKVLKFFYFFLFALFGWLTYSSVLRFQFLGWMIPIGYYLTRDVKPSNKIIGFLVGLFIVMIIFSSAGVLRNKSIADMTWSEFYQKSFERLQVAEDINFIDGFIMVYQVYPKMLDYTHGLEHISILIRPIPRTIWPDKPLAGWVQNYGKKYNDEIPNVGFSPTLYGVFYAEGGEVGIVILSVVWGYLLNYIYFSFKVFKSNLHSILIGVLLSSMIPIFRSGDLAGDFAIVLMSYWPLIIFVRQYKKYLKGKSIKI